MAEYQNGKKLSAGEVASIVTWLKSLTGELPLDFIRKPQCPPPRRRRRSRTCRSSLPCAALSPLSFSSRCPPRRRKPTPAPARRHGNWASISARCSRRNSPRAASRARWACARTRRRRKPNATPPSTGFEIRRVSLKARNGANRPDEWERARLTEWENALKEGRPLPEAAEGAAQDGAYRLLLPIRIQAMCLTCHGNARRSPPGESDASRSTIPRGCRHGLPQRRFARRLQRGDSTLGGFFSVWLAAGRRDPASQELAIQVGTPRLGSTHFIRAK
jgi:hypothetical protein